MHNRSDAGSPCISSPTATAASSATAGPGTCATALQSGSSDEGNWRQSTTREKATHGLLSPVFRLNGPHLTC